MLPYKLLFTCLCPVEDDHIMICRVPSTEVHEAYGRRLGYTATRAKNSLGIPWFSTAQYLQRIEKCGWPSAQLINITEIPVHLCIILGQLVSALFWTGVASSFTLQLFLSAQGLPKHAPTKELFPFSFLLQSILCASSSLAKFFCNMIDQKYILSVSIQSCFCQAFYIQNDRSKPRTEMRS